MGLWRGKKNKPSKGSNAASLRFKSELDRVAGFFGEDRQKSIRYLTVLLISLLFTIIFFVWVMWTNRTETQLTRSLGELQLLSQQISSQSAEASVRGDKEIVNELQQSRTSFEEELDVVVDKHSDTETVEKLVNEWSQVDNNIELIVGQQQTISELQGLGLQITEAIPGIQSEYNLLVDEMTRGGYSASQVALAKKPSLSL